MIRGCGVARPKPWEVDDDLWAVIEPLLPKVERRARHPGRKRHSDRLVFQGILFVLHTGIAWEHLPQELGFGSGMTCWGAWPSGRRPVCGRGSTRLSWRSCVVRTPWTSPGQWSTAPTSGR
jgi:transposase